MSNGISGTRIASAPPARPGVRGDPARVAAHDLDDDDAVVRLGGGVQAVDGVRGDLHRGVEAEGHVGAGQVVVDRLRHADHLHAVGREPARDAERVLAADRHERVDAEALHRRPHRRRAVGAALVRVRARGAEDRAAAVQDARRRQRGELHRRALQHAGPSVAEAEQLVPALDPRAHDAADDRVEPRAVAPTGQHPDSHGRECYAVEGVERKSAKPGEQLARTAQAEVEGLQAVGLVRRVEGVVGQHEAGDDDRHPPPELGHDGDRAARAHERGPRARRALERLDGPAIAGSSGGKSAGLPPSHSICTSAPRGHRGAQQPLERRADRLRVLARREAHGEGRARVGGHDRARLAGHDLRDVERRVAPLRS
jgi:hypothetical protein